MKIGSFEFNLRELAGSMGDFGTLIPFAVGYIAVCGLNPAGFLVMMGLTNIALALVYKLPMPLEPKKVLAVMAISQGWSPSMIYASGFGLGVIWLFLAATGFIQKLVKITPRCVTRGIQLTLGIMLAIQGIKMISTWWSLGLISIILVIWLRENKRAPAAIVLMILGLAVVALKGQLLGIWKPGFSLPPVTAFSIKEVWETFIRGGIGQLPLTLTNAVIATAALIAIYFPSRPVSERKLILNMGIMNVTVPFFGGMPMCHGAGGLAGQYYFGARTGGANIIEGLIEIGLGLFLSTTILRLFQVFPMSIIGGMMFLVGIQLTKFVKDIRIGKELIPTIATVGVALATNMAGGYICGLAVYHGIRFIFRVKGKCSCGGGANRS